MSQKNNKRRERPKRPRDQSEVSDDDTIRYWAQQSIYEIAQQSNVSTLREMLEFLDLAPPRQNK